MNTIKVLIKSLTFKGVIGIFFNTLQATAHSLIIGFALMFIFDNHLTARNISGVLILLVFMITYFIVLIPIFGYFMETNGNKFLLLIQKKFFKKILITDVILTENEHSSKFSNMLNIDTREVSTLIGWKTIALVQAIIAGVISTVTIGIFSPFILLILFVIGISSILINLFFAKIVQKLTKQKREYEDTRLKNVIEIVNNFALLAFFKGLQNKIEKSKGNIRFLYTLDRKLNNAINISSTISNFIFEGLFFGITILVGVFQISNGHLTFGSLLLILQMISGLSFLFGYIVNYIIGFQSTLISLKNVEKIMKVNNLSDKEISLELDKVQKIEFSNVTFSYEENNNTISNLSFIINLPGEVMLKGANGAGKSTVFKLLMGVFQPLEGEIKINGVNIKSYNPLSISKKIAYVPQFPKFYNDTLYNNIVLGRETVSNIDVYSLLELVNLEKLVEKMKEDVNFIFNENDGNLSQGEKTRLAIARALVTSPDVILLDEIESHLDRNNTEIIMKNIYNAYPSISIIKISHIENAENNLDDFLGIIVNM